MFAQLPRELILHIFKAAGIYNAWVFSLTCRYVRRTFREYCAKLRIDNNILYNFCEGIACVMRGQNPFTILMQVPDIDCLKFAAANFMNISKFDRRYVRNNFITQNLYSQLLKDYRDNLLNRDEAILIYEFFAANFNIDEPSARLLIYGKIDDVDVTIGNLSTILRYGKNEDLLIRFIDTLDIERYFEIILRNCSPNEGLTMRLFEIIVRKPMSAEIIAAFRNNYGVYMRFLFHILRLQYRFDLLFVQNAITIMRDNIDDFMAKNAGKLIEMLDESPESYFVDLFCFIAKLHRGCGQYDNRFLVAKLLEFYRMSRKDDAKCGICSKMLVEHTK